MEGPFTCEDLRNIRPQVIQAEVDKLTGLIVQDIKKSIINKASSGLSSYYPPPIDASSLAIDPFQANQRPITSKYQFIYETNRMRAHRLVNMNLINGYVTTDSLVEDVTKRLKKIFPDMTMVVDPLKTYILFDWSS